MPTLTINLSLTEDELRLLFDRYFNQPEKIVLSSSGFQNLLDEIDRKPSEETLKRREKIKNTLCGNDNDVFETGCFVR